jgi:cation transport regulator ChaC
VVVDVLPYSRKLAVRLSVIRGTVHTAGASLHLEYSTISVFVVYFTTPLGKRHERRMRISELEMRIKEAVEA